MTAMDWTSGDAGTHLARVRRLTERGIVEAARNYDWDKYPETVLGWIMAQKCVDLDTALAAFFGGCPERFNYLHKREVPPEFQSTCRVLDNICLRVNSGFYLLREDRTPVAAERLEKWLAVQKIDRRENSSGRWVLDEAIVSKLLVAAAPKVDPGPTGSLPKPPRRAPGPLARLAGVLRPGRAR